MEFLGSVWFSGLLMILSIVIFFVLSLRGLSIIPCALISTSLIAIALPQGIIATLVGGFSQGIGMFASNIAIPMMTGGLFAATFTASGCGDSVGKFFVGKLGAAAAPYIIAIVVMFLGLGGIDSMPFVVAPIAFSLLKSANLPRSLGAAIMVGFYTLPSFCLPGSTQVTNILASQSLGTTLFAAPVMGIVAFAVGLILDLLYVRYVIKKCRRENIGYTPSPVELTLARPPDDQEPPRFFIALFPLILIFAMCFGLQFGLKWDSSSTVAVAQFSASAFIFIFCWKRIKEKAKVISNGLGTATFPIVAAGCIMGFSAVASQLPAYNAMIEGLGRMNISPYLTVLIGVSILCAITAGPVTGIAAFLPIVGPKVVAMGANPSAVHRLAMLTSTTFDTMPHSIALNINFQVMGVSHKDAYKDVMVLQIVNTLIYTLVGLVMAILFY